MSLSYIIIYSLVLFSNIFSSYIHTGKSDSSISYKSNQESAAHESPCDIVNDLGK